jgi:8-oxo-dGTP pyrophosphatase MutT (NUDIX family)
LLKPLPRLSTSTLHKNPWWEYRHDRYLHPDDSEGDFFYIHTPGAVFVIPELPDGRVLMLRQFRYLNQRESLEFVGGGLKAGLTHEEAAREELLEEGGYTAAELIPLGWFNPMNGASDEECHVFLARGLTPATSKPEISEEFEPLAVTFDELSGLIQSGEIWDGMTLAAYSLYCFRNGPL